jgi:hypothetical protein
MKELKGTGNGWPTCTPNAGNARNSASASDTCIKGGSSRFPSKTTNTSIPWCGTSSETPCGPDWSLARRTGGGEVSISVCGKHAGLCCAIGRCRSRPIGRSTSTCRRPRRNSNPFAKASVAEVLTAMPPGSSKRQSNSDYSQRSAAAAVLPGEMRELITMRILPNICACPLFVLGTC